MNAAVPVAIAEADIDEMRRRLDARTDKSGDCWMWTGTVIKAIGRPYLYYRGRQIYAYRVAWFLAHGEIPDQLCVCHTCDTPMCVRLEHLFLGTRSDNNRDMAQKGRHLGSRFRNYGELHHNVTRPDALVIEAQRLYAEGGRTYADVGRILGISRGSARDWILGRSRGSGTGRALAPRISRVLAEDPWAEDVA